MSSKKKEVELRVAKPSKASVKNPVRVKMKVAASGHVTYLQGNVSPKLVFEADKNYVLDAALAIHLYKQKKVQIHSADKAAFELALSEQDKKAERTVDLKNKSMEPDYDHKSAEAAKVEAAKSEESSLEVDGEEGEKEKDLNKNRKNGKNKKDGDESEEA